MSSWTGWRRRIVRRHQSAQPRAERLLLFVCGGNTCRSAMAEAFAQAELATAGATANWQALSAGTGATPETPIRREAGAALRELGIRAGRPRARALTREMVHHAEMVYCMTAAQVDHVLSIAPDTGSKVVCLDPAGDLPDPIGLSQAGYLNCARHIRNLVHQRLSELNAFSPVAGRA